MNQNFSYQEIKPITIVFFGRTGAGKSTLANKILRKEHFKVGHSLASETESVASEVCVWPLNSSLMVKVIDTPGFADNRPEMTNTVLLSKILDFLKNMKDGLTIAVYCLPAKSRIDRHDTQELEMLGLLLGSVFFDHVYLAITQVDTLMPEHRQKTCQNFVNDLPGIFMKNGLPSFTKEKILFTDFENLEKSFLEPLTNFIKTTTSYVPELSEEIDTEDPESIKRFLAKPEMKEIMKLYEDRMTAQKLEIAALQQAIGERSQETQQLLSEHRQKQKDLQNDLERVREQLRSTKIQNQNHRKQLEDFARNEEMKLNSLRKSMSSLTRQNENMQSLMERRENEINTLNSRIDELNRARQQATTVYYEDDDDDDLCNIF